MHCKETSNVKCLLSDPRRSPVCSLNQVVWREKYTNEGFSLINKAMIQGMFKSEF